MKRVLIITYYWPPSGGAGVQRWLKFAKYLPEFGWEPIILTVDPEFASYPVSDETLNREVAGNIRVIRTESREWFSFYKKVSGTEKIPYAGFANEKPRVSFKQKIARFIRGNFFLPDPRKGWNKYALNAARELLDKEKADCIITTSPPHSTQLIGLTLSQEYSIPWVADFRDPWTDIYYYRQFYPTWFAHKYNLHLERSVLENTSLTITVGETHKQRFLAKLKRKGDNIHVITNGYDPEDFEGLTTEKRTDRKFIITYVGTMADNYPVESFLEVMASYVKDHKNTLIRFIGTLPAGHRKRILLLPEENTEIIPYVDHSRAIEYMYNSDVLLLVIPSTEKNSGIIPGKVFEYIAVQRPILLLGPEDGDTARIVKESFAGNVAEPSNKDRIRDLIDEWRSNPPTIQKNGRYDKKEQTKFLSSLLESACQKHIS